MWQKARIIAGDFAGACLWIKPAPKRERPFEHGVQLSKPILVHTVALKHKQRAVIRAEHLELLAEYTHYPAWLDYEELREQQATVAPDHQSKTIALGDKAYYSYSTHLSRAEAETAEAALAPLPGERPLVAEYEGEWHLWLPL